VLMLSLARFYWPTSELGYLIAAVAVALFGVVGYSVWISGYFSRQLSARFAR
jgi:hypothetical protein